MSKRSSVVAMLTACVVMAAGCSSDSSEGGDSTGVTDTSVTIGSHQPLTGPASPGFGDVAPAAKAYFDYVNARGGVHGRKIIYKYRDDAYDPVRTVSVVRQLVEQDKVFAIFNGLGTPTHTKVVDYLNARKVPDLLVTSGCTCWDAPEKYPYTFGYLTDYVREGKILGAYIKKNFPGKRVAYFTQDDQLGQDGIKGLDKEIPAASVVSRQVYQPGNLDITPQVAAIDQAKADVIVAFGIPQYTAQLRKAQLKLGNSAQLVLSTSSGGEPTTLVRLLQDATPDQSATSLIQGIITDAAAPLPNETRNPWIQLFTKVRNEYATSLPLTTAMVAGMTAAYTFVQALQVAGPDLTRQSMVSAMEKGGFTGPSFVPFAFSKTSHAGGTGTRVGSIKGTAIEYQGPPMTTDNGNGPVVPYDASPATPPANGIPTTR
ncbi:ABC transporter substrate-binding protein [Streptomyces sp. NBC_01017]|uniref:ABC transporter substrate-binding protein n=1 Tax=Streptomyces sp. NBC_01017 TaxID=2903721 RepID=UPI00386474AB|nr:ABC transporter substrate-binding protein [Streptomyces sp. NBC_01017]WSV34947.1 ABC transporter substrate-binding protein [Streptomyces sp. NBC_01017]